MRLVIAIFLAGLVVYILGVVQVITAFHHV